MRPVEGEVVEGRCQGTKRQWELPTVWAKG